MQSERSCSHLRLLPFSPPVVPAEQLPSKGGPSPSPFSRLAGYEDVNDAVRLRHDPAMRWIIGGKAAKGLGASPSQMGRAWRSGEQCLERALRLHVLPSALRLQ